MLTINPNDEEEFKLLLDTFDVIFQNSLDMILLLDTSGNILDANIQACRYLGLMLKDLKGKPFRNFVREKKEYNSFLKLTNEKGKALQRFVVASGEQGLIPFDISSSLVTNTNENMIVLLCRDVQNLVDSDAQRQFLYELFQHDLLNKLHAEIGFIDFYNKITSEDDKISAAAIQMISKIRELTVRSIYLIQNVNIMLMLKDYKALVNQQIEDIINHTIRYLDSFFGGLINTELVRIHNYLVAGDDYLYRVFVNLIIHMLEKNKHNISVEITVEKPSPSTDISTIILHFEDVVLSQKEKMAIYTSDATTISNLDIVVIQTLLSRYHLKLKIEDIKRKGEIVGTRMLLSVPIASVDV